MHEFYPVKFYRFLRLFFSDANWRLTLDENSAVIREGAHSSSVRYADIDNVATSGIVFPALMIDTKEGVFYLPRFGMFAARRASGALREKIQGTLAREFAGLTAEIGAEVDALYGRDAYISSRALKQWQTSTPGLKERAKAARNIAKHILFNRKKTDGGVLSMWDGFLPLLEENRPAELTARNEEYVRREEVKHRGFFDKIENSPLTGEQRRAAIIMEDRNLLVAAAGSGKTSAIVGKIGYILKKEYCGPSEILALAFNKKAAAEMQERIGRRLGETAAPVSVKTFHKCGLDIIAEASKAKPSVADWTTDMGENTSANREWEEMVNAAARGGDFNALLLYFRWAVKPIHLFNSKNDYENHLLSLRAKKSGNNWGVQTIKGEWVRSLEEAAIANWLYANGVEYEYEKPYPHAPATSEFRQYTPDFYYPQIGAYHEHFALDQNGKAPRFFAPDYAEEAKRKRNIHAQNNTTLIETTSAMFHEGDIFAYLKEQLSARGITFAPRSAAEISDSITRQFVKPLYSIMQSFLSHWKSGGFSENELLRRAGELSGFRRIRTETFLRVMFRVRRAYEEKLRAKNEIDFEDMIGRAAHYLRGGHRTQTYKAVLVDEFQDISRSRARLIKEILKQNPDCAMFAVGDDWQSIYRFAGADISVMVDFASEFGATSQNYLRKTFRSNRGIAEAAARFVAKNPSQLPKEVQAENGDMEAVVQAVNYYKKGEDEIFIENQLRQISGAPRRAKVYVLARYNHLKPENFGKWRKNFGKTIDIEFSTVHSAKGKEADYVFVVGMNSGEYGFPSEAEYDPVLQIVMPKPEQFEQAEERRLFYVALTRARQKVFLLAKKHSRSAFISEILENDYIAKEYDWNPSGNLGASAVFPTCPECGGAMVERAGYNKNKFLGCFNYPKCTHTAPLPPQSSAAGQKRRPGGRKPRFGGRNRAK